VDYGLSYIDVKIAELEAKKIHSVKSYTYEGSKPLILIVKGHKTVLHKGDEVTMNERYLKTRKLKTLLKEVKSIEPKEIKQ